MKTSQLKTFSAQIIEPYKIGYSEIISTDHAEDIIKLIKNPSGESSSVLGGRRKVNIYELANIGRVAVKHYLRGGLLHYLVKEKYVKWGKTRGQLEFEWLHLVRQLGISAPEPIAFVFDGQRFYKCWLITREIKNHKTFAELSFTPQNNLEELMDGVLAQVFILIQNRILHVDLHPGNVLIDNEGKAFIIDFDKAKFFKGSNTDLRYRYISRWQRAVKKHGLPGLLSTSFKKGLLERGL